jgi:hypothetical protein
MRPRSPFDGSVAAHLVVLMRRSILVAIALIALLVGACGSGTTPLGSPDPQTTTVTQGRYALALTIDRATVHPTTAITGAATLSLLTPGSVTMTGPTDFVGFEFSEVGGNGRHVVPTTQGDCAVHTVTSRDSIVTPIAKSGAAVDGPDADWYRQFLADPVVHLPKGDWDITAIAGFIDGRGCIGQALDLRATVRVHVID